MKLSDWLPSVFVEGDGDDIQVTTKKFSQFPTATGDGIQGVGIKGGNNVKFDLTTDSIKVNPEPFRNARGQFVGTPEELADIENQRDVNNFLYQAINDIEAGEIDIPPGTIVSEDAPEDVEEGQCWYDTGRLELFVYADGGWFPCSPLGARVDAGEALQAQILARVEAGEAKQATIESSALKTSGNNTIDTTWRIKSDGKTIVSGAESGKIKIYHLAEPTDGDHAATKSYADGKLSKEGGSLFGILNMHDHYIAGVKTPSSGTDAANKSYVDGNFIGRASYTVVEDDWSVKQKNEELNNRTLFSASGGSLNIYNLNEPTDTHHAATKSYVDEIADLKLSLSGGTSSKMTGNLYMGGNKIAGLETPSIDTDAANKSYVDTAVAGSSDPYYTRNYILNDYKLVGSADPVGGQGAFKWVREDGSGFTNLRDAHGVCFDIRKVPDFYDELRLKLDIGTPYGSAYIYVWDESIDSPYSLIAKFRINNKGDYDTQGGGSFIVYGDQCLISGSDSTTHNYRLELIGF
jgi:hypothetical protein